MLGAAPWARASPTPARPARTPEMPACTETASAAPLISASRRVMPLISLAEATSVSLIGSPPCLTSLLYLRGLVSSQHVTNQVPKREGDCQESRAAFQSVQPRDPRSRRAPTPAPCPGSTDRSSNRRADVEAFTEVLVDGPFDVELGPVRVVGCRMPEC